MIEDKWKNHFCGSLCKISGLLREMDKINNHYTENHRADTEKHRENAKQLSNNETENYFLFKADLRIINPTIPDNNEPARIPTLEIFKSSGEVNARLAMNNDIVNPIPASTEPA